MKLSLAMANPNPIGDFLQFIISGCLFGSGGFLLANQVRVRSAVTYNSYRSRNGGWGDGGGFAMPFGAPGMGLLMLPLAHANHRIGLICLAGFACCGFLAWNDFLVSSNKSIKVKLAIRDDQKFLVGSNFRLLSNAQGASSK